MRKNILSHGHGWMRFMDENINAKWQWMNFSWTFAIGYIPNKIQKKYVSLLWTIHRMLKLHLNFKSHYYQVYSDFVESKPYKIWIKSNSISHKPIDPPRGMCQFKH
jgi:hypothetical protein